ncbi:hypothetical protein [Microbacterium sp. bgisy207]|jgi:hypothetical protein|uniref:hypothetical protein n=1 Tax=Microbacterium sp. bgisy207 TaxID=3413800 RepID=UPI003EBC9F58
MAVRHASSSPDEHEHVIDIQVQAVHVRRSPRYGRILGAGIVAGVLIAAALTVVGSTSGRGVASSGEAGIVWAFGLNAMVCVAICLLVSAGIILTVERRNLRRIRAARAAQEVTFVDDLSRPMTDQLPPWMRDES